MGSYRFMILFYLSGILGGLGWSLLALPGTYCVGASGGLMGTLGAFAALYPNTFIVVVHLPGACMGIGSWIGAVGVERDDCAPRIGGIANAAHLMGGIAGFLMHLLGGMVNAFSIGGRDFLHLEVNQFRKVLRRGYSLEKRLIDSREDRARGNGFINSDRTGFLATCYATVAIF